MRKGEWGANGELFEKLHKARYRKNELFEKLKVAKEKSKKVNDQRQELVFFFLINRLI